MILNAHLQEGSLLSKPETSLLYGNVSDFFQGLGRMFYLVNPTETTFNDSEDVPQYFRQAWPYFLAFMLLENFLLWINRKPIYRLNDGLTSLSHGLIQECGRLVWRGAESYAYIYIFNNYRIVDLPWNYRTTWYLAALGIDFGYYWMHRACHEVHILWAQHQVHHSSEEFNMAVGLRQSMFQGWSGFLFYLPLALIIPPTYFVTHYQFNLLYQFWIHTKVVETLGPLEHIFNTPNHHRVHHGSNLYCLDKNYGGVLIVWDRIFGTFAKENPKEEIIYGLVVNHPSFNPLRLQTFYTLYVFEKFKSMISWKDKFAAIFYGPSWQPGRPRLGVDEDKLKVTSRTVYDVQLPKIYNLYALSHFLSVIYFLQELFGTYVGMNPIYVMGFACCIIASLTSIGLIFDNSPYSWAFELMRCSLLIFWIRNDEIFKCNYIILLSLQGFFSLSCLFWILRALRVINIKVTKNSD